MKNIILLGATGSIGTQVLDLVDELKDYNVYAVAFGNNVSKAIDIIDKYHPTYVTCKNEKDVKILQSKYPTLYISYGRDGLNNLAKLVIDNPIFINALVGSVGLEPTIKAIESGKDIYLANKETLVIGGELVTASCKKYGVNLYPIDSEHSALQQIIEGKDTNQISKLIITASGGALRNLSYDELKNVTKVDALKHPNWQMGEKITIDCATMINKGFELIEAHYLFNLPMDKIMPIIHEESIIHAMVEFNDGAILSQLASPDMHLPIRYAVTHEHGQSNHINRLDVETLSTLHFRHVDYQRYPLLKCAIDACNKGGYYPTILNAANEAAVRLFLDDKITYYEMEDIVKNELNNDDYNIYHQKELNLDDILELDQIIKNKYWK